MRIMLLIPAFSGGGAEKQCIFLANALAERDDADVFLVHFHEGVNYSLINRSIVKTFRLETTSNYNPGLALKLAKLIRLLRPDVVFSWLHASDVFTWLARPLSRGFSWAVAERNSWYPKELRYLIRELAALRSDVVISNSAKGDVYWSKRGLPSGRRRVVDNILPSCWFERGLAAPTRATVAYAGRMEEQKCISRLIEAFIHLAQRRPEISFRVAGEGSQRPKVQASIEASGLTNITLEDFQKDVKSFFEASTVFVNISRHEGKPNTVIENLAIGNRVVLSRIPEHIELVGENYPFLVDCDAGAEEVSAMIDRAAITPVSTEELREIHERFGPMRAAAVANHYISIFRQIRSLDIKAIAAGAK